jgi:hypothetical protein
MRPVKFLLAGAVVVLALGACSSSSKPSASGPTTTTKVLTQADFCAKVQSQADAFDLSGISGKSKDELKRIYNDNADQLDQLVAIAPPAIKDDMQSAVNLIKQVHAALVDVDYDPSQLSLSALPGLTSPSTLAAGARIASYLRDDCHIVSSQSEG